MTKIRTILLASASVVALSGGSAFAADMAVKAAPYYAAPTWTGGYIGGEVGVARLNGTCSQIDPSYGYYGACSSYYGSSGQSASATGAMGGVYLGYDWQVDRSFLVGVVGDFDWAGLKQTVGNNSSDYGGYFTAKVDWLASARGRMGVLVDNNLIYMTGGVAWAGIKSTATMFYDSASVENNIGRVSDAQVGWVAGGGIEHKFASNWSVKAEALYYDFGSVKNDLTYVAVEGESYRTEFSHEVIAAKIGAAYHF